MGTELIIPEIMLIEKLEETDTSFAPALWTDLKNEITIIAEQDKNLPKPLQQKKRMFFSDFVNKAISLPIEFAPQLSEEAQKELYRLHLFCCQQSVHCPEVRRNPLILGFHALKEMKLALMGIMISYRLINPSCPYSWNRAFFESHIFTDKGPDGHTIIRFLGIPQEDLNKAITKDIISDWLIYRGYGSNGIRTLMDIKTRLQTLPDYRRGGHPADEFSRFERKMQEHHNRKEMRKEEALDLEYRKTLVRTVAEKTASELLSSGMSTQELLQAAFAADISKLAAPAKENKKVKPKPKQDTEYIEDIISGYLKDDS